MSRRIAENSLTLFFKEKEKTVSRKLRINAKEVMRIAEKLYTQGFVVFLLGFIHQYRLRYRKTKMNTILLVT